MRKGPDGSVEQPAAERAARRWRAIPLPLMIVSIVLAMVVAVLALEEQAEAARRAEASLNDIQVLANELNSEVLEMFVPGRAPDSQTLLDLIDSKTVETTRLIEESARQIEGSGPIDSVAEDFATYRDALSQALSLLRDGRFTSAAAVNRARVAPSFDVLHERLADTAVSFRDRAVGAERIRDIGSIVTLLLGGLFVTLLARRSGQMRRRLDETHARESALGQSERRFLSLMAGSFDMVTILDEGGRIRFQSASVERMLGWKIDDLVGNDIREFLVGDAGGVDALLDRAKHNPGMPTSADWHMRKASGETAAVEAIIVDKFDDPDIAGFLVNVRDLSERVLLEEALRHQALHDPLTSLPNRVLFEDRLDHAFDRTARSGESVCVLLADLDDFKDINDSSGHALGDRVLIEVARRLRSIVRPEDTVARLGGDEFGILIDEVQREYDGAEVAERILAALAEPMRIADADMYTGASIGIVTGSAVGTSPDRRKDRSEQMLVDADLAMYEAKRLGRGRFQFFASSMQEDVRERVALKSDLQRGLSRGEFLLHYQPIVSIESGAIVGAEALVRWKHPERGLVPPMQFIPLAEQTGLIIELGRWVLGEACAEAARWQATYGAAAPYVSVNAAGPQLHQHWFVDEVRRTLESTGLGHGRLVIEFTESTLIDDTERNLLKIERLRDLGLRIAVDDFGTGYSSLSYLQRYNMDILKIDKSFIDGLGQQPKGSALVAAMVGIGSALGMEVVAEGIEDRTQLERLRALHCDLGQGYLFARPQPADQLAELLNASLATTETTAPAIFLQDTP